MRSWFLVSLLLSRLVSAVRNTEDLDLGDLTPVDGETEKTEDEYTRDLVNGKDCAELPDMMVGAMNEFSDFLDKMCDDSGCIFPDTETALQTVTDVKGKFDLLIPIADAKLCLYETLTDSRVNEARSRLETLMALVRQPVGNSIEDKWRQDAWSKLDSWEVGLSARIGRLFDRKNAQRVMECPKECAYCKHNEARWYPGAAPLPNDPLEAYVDFDCILPRSLRKTLPSKNDNRLSCGKPYRRFFWQRFTTSCHNMQHKVARFQFSHLQAVLSCASVSTLAALQGKDMPSPNMRDCVAKKSGVFVDRDLGAPWQTRYRVFQENLPVFEAELRDVFEDWSLSKKTRLQVFESFLELELGYGLAGARFASRGEAMPVAKDVDEYLGDKVDLEDGAVTFDATALAHLGCEPPKQRLFSAFTSVVRELATVTSGAAFAAVSALPVSLGWAWSARRTNLLQQIGAVALSPLVGLLLINTYAGPDGSVRRFIHPTVDCDAEVLLLPGGNQVCLRAVYSNHHGNARNANKTRSQTFPCPKGGPKRATTICHRSTCSGYQTSPWNNCVEASRTFDLSQCE